MKKYVFFYNFKKKIECIIILWWVLVLLFVSLISRLPKTLNCTLYHTFTQVCLKHEILKQFAIKKLNEGNKQDGDLIPWMALWQFEDVKFPSLQMPILCTLLCILM
jgi:hypothetical protein